MIYGEWYELYVSPKRLGDMCDEGTLHSDVPDRCCFVRICNQLHLFMA